MASLPYYSAQVNTTNGGLDVAFELHDVDSLLDLEVVADAIKAALEGVSGVLSVTQTYKHTVANTAF